MLLCVPITFHDFRK